jgi:hypothetical protein
MIGRSFRRFSIQPNKESDLKIGRAIDILRHDLTHFFDQGLSDTHIYSPHIRLIEPYHSGFHIATRPMYLRTCTAVRWSTKMWYHLPQIHILHMRMLEKDETHQAKLYVRWIMEATPRWLLWMAPKEYGTMYEGSFVYVFNKEGEIHEHRIESIYPAPSPLTMTRWLSLLLGRPLIQPGLSYKD